MLVIRLQRTGRHGHATYRMVVQDSRWSPKSGKVVSLLGNYDPHAKTAVFDKDKAASFLKNGAQPSERVARLLKTEGVKLPSWVPKPTKKAGKVRNPEKLAGTAPAAKPETAEAPAAEKPKVETSPETETPTEAETPAEETPEAEATEEIAAEPAETAAPAEPPSDLSAEASAKAEEPEKPAKA